MTSGADASQFNTARRMMADLERADPRCRQAFDRLISSGCREEELVAQYLALLKASLRRTNRTPADLKVLARRLQVCATELDRFGRSVLGGVVGAGGERRRLVKDLHDFRSSLQQWTERKLRSRNFWEGRALTLLSEYVRHATRKGQTRKAHWNDLDILASAVLGRKVSVRERVDRHKKFSPGT